MEAIVEKICKIEEELQRRKREDHLSGYNTGEKIHKKLYELAVFSGIAEKDDSYKTAAEKFIEKIKTLNKNMSVPEKLQGIKEEDIPVMSKHADREGNPLYHVPVLKNLPPCMLYKSLSRCVYIQVQTIKCR